MLRRRLVLATAWALAVVLLAAGTARAQLSGGYAVASFQFNLSNPGARSLAMGGAFTGLADDATAAYANPAGLTILTRPEISYESRTTSFRVPLARAEPLVAGVTQLRNLDGATVGQLWEGASRLESLGAPEATGTTASFMSLVAPLRDWTFALYRHQLVELEARGQRALTPFEAGIQFDDGTGLTFGFSGSSQAAALLDVYGVGLAVAHRVSDRFSVGMTVIHSRARIEAFRAGRFLEECVTCEGFDFLLDDSVETRLRGDDTDETINVGLLMRPTPRLAVGLVYRQGPSFALEEVEQARYIFDGREIPGQSGRQVFSGESFRVPDVLGLGGSYRVTRRLVVLAEWDRVQYSKLRGLARSPRALFYSAQVPPESLDVLGRFQVDDGDEIRAGLEYSFWNLPTTPALRLGAWYETDHQVRFEAAAFCPSAPEGQGSEFRCRAQRLDAGGLDIDQVYELLQPVADATAAAALEQLFPPGEDRLHITGGFGVVLGSRYQLDAAFDYVDSGLYFLSLSGVVRF